MTEVSEGEIQTEGMDHHGLVAAVCQDLKIAQGIDNPPDFRILEPSPSEEVIFGHYTPISNARILPTSAF